jgi:hypothetical protein
MTVEALNSEPKAEILGSDNDVADNLGEARSPGECVDCLIFLSSFHVL